MVPTARRRSSTTASPSGAAAATPRPACSPSYSRPFFITKRPCSCSGCSRADSRRAPRGRRACPTSSEPRSLRVPIASAPKIVADAEHVDRRRAAARDVPDLPVVAEPLELAVAADADPAARIHDLLRLGGDERDASTGSRCHQPGRRSPRAQQLTLRREAAELRVLQDVVVLVPVVLRPRAAVQHEQRRRVVMPLSAKQLDVVLVERRDRAASARCRRSRRSLPSGSS